MISDKEGGLMFRKNLINSFYSRRPRLHSMLAIIVFALVAADGTFAATDPGVRGGAAGAGEPLTGVTEFEQDFFFAGQKRFLIWTQYRVQSKGSQMPGSGPDLMVIVVLCAMYSPQLEEQVLS
jgi:hypothetical protein